MTESLIASNLLIGGDSTIAVGGTDINCKQYIYLVGTEGGVIYETGMYPSRFYTISDNGYAVNIVPNGVSFGSPKGEALNITAGSDGVVWYSAGLSHEFTKNVVMHDNLGFIDNFKYIDIIKTLKNARDAGVLNLVDFDGNIVE